MKKILVVLALLVCSTGVFAQYIHSQGGVVSQGTLVNEKKEVVAARKGWDGWIGVGGGIGGSIQADANFGYNTTNARGFFGVGYKYFQTPDFTLGSWYLNMRTFASNKANSFFFSYRLGYTLIGTIYEKENNNGDYSYIMPKGIMGGLSFGYLWNHFSFELGGDLMGGLHYESSKKIINPYGLDWTDKEHVESEPFAIDLFVKLSWRF